MHLVTLVQVVSMCVCVYVGGGGGGRGGGEHVRLSAVKNWFPFVYVCRSCTIKMLVD